MKFQGILYAVFKGFVDSLKGTIVIFYLDKNIRERALKSPTREHSARRKESATPEVAAVPKKHEEPKILTRTLQCCGLNGVVFWCSIIIFECLVLPSLKYLVSFLFGHSSGMDKSVWFWMKPFLSWTFSATWVLPLFILSKVVNSLWFQDIADSAYRYSRGRPQLLSSVSKLIADTLFSILVQALFLVQSMLVSMLPIAPVGDIVCLVHMCLLYSLYAFEYKWFNMGWELHKRLTFLEGNWPYFVGFGLPLAVLTAIPSSYIVSGCVFSILFPLFIISGNEAEPVTGVCDCPLQLFSPVIAISNAIFSKTIGKKASSHSKTRR
ncbi:hypothetical protein J437_LFUL004095 [Ladona fulva]|uniref:Etoposide-induced protein 2.4 homolog n=1 Tax=Ladona fulva TaxID=123851 RepID=A0A8K0K224_LADFU|nr:hypothetical protein J437_LFUL004095 [Ladona fulva]